MFWAARMRGLRYNKQSTKQSAKNVAKQEPTFECNKHAQQTSLAHASIAASIQNATTTGRKSNSQATHVASPST